MVTPQTSRHANLQQQTSGADINFGIVTAGGAIAVNDAARGRSNAHATCTCGDRLNGNVTAGSLQQDVAVGACGRDSLRARLRHRDRHCRHDVNGHAGGGGADVRVLQQSAANVEADITGPAAQISIQRHVGGATTRFDEHISNCGDTHIVCITLIHCDATCGG